MPKVRLRNSYRTAHISGCKWGKSTILEVIFTSTPVMWQSKNGPFIDDKAFQIRLFSIAMLTKPEGTSHDIPMIEFYLMIFPLYVVGR